MKARVWIDNDNFYVFVEVVINGDIVSSFDEWGKPFTKEYVKTLLTYKYGGDIEIQFM